MNKESTLEENKKSIDLACSKINARNNGLLNQVKELEEHKKKSPSTLAQGKEKLENFLNDKEGSIRRLGFYSENVQPPTCSRGPKNAYAKGKGKANVFP